MQNRNRSTTPSRSKLPKRNKSTQPILTKTTKHISTTTSLNKTKSTTIAQPTLLSHSQLQPLHSILSSPRQHHHQQQPHQQLKLFHHSHLQFSTTSSSSSSSLNNNDSTILGASKLPPEEKMIPLSAINKEYLFNHPEIALRAKFNRIPTREEVTGLVPDEQRDNIKFQFPGDKKLRDDQMLRIRDDEKLKLEHPRQTQETLKLALNTSTSSLSESLLSLAIAEPLPYRTNNELETAEVNIAHELTIAPSWNVDDPQAEQQIAVQQVTQSEAIYKGDLKKATAYIQKRIQEAEDNNLPYFKPTGNVQIDEMNKRNLQRGILPIPNFAGDNNPELTPDDITQIDQMAQSLARHVEVTTSAKQPFDTASKVVKRRLTDLPTDPEQFFPNAGFPSINTRTHHAYSRYLRLLSTKFALTQALDIADEIKRRGMFTTPAIYIAFMSCLKQHRTSEKDKKRMLKEMMLNKPNLDKTATYIDTPEWVGNVTVLPKDQPSHNSPAGFISAAPNIATYGGVGLRGEFNVNVEYAFYLFEKSKEAGIVPTKQMFTAVMDVCAAHGHMERAFALFHEFKRYGEGQYIDPKLATSSKEIALAKPFRDAKLQGYKVDTIMALTLMNACQRSKFPRLVEETFHRFWEEGLQPDAPMYNLVIVSCANGGYVEKAFKYFEQLQHFGHTPSIITYTSLIRACSCPSRPEFYPKAFEVFHECISAGFRPDGILFHSLIDLTGQQADLHNLISIFRLIVRDFPHLITIELLSKVAIGIGNSMSNEKLPGFGGYVLTRTGRTLFGTTITGIPEEDAQITSTKKIKLTREDRLAMIDALYSEAILRTESQDRAGTNGGIPFTINNDFLTTIINAYCNAASGILAWDRHERKEGREDPLLRLTPAHIDQLVERTWNKIVTIQSQHPHIFELSSNLYQRIFSMYGAADRLEHAVYHLLYLTRGLKVKVTKPTFLGLLDWCEKNAHHGAGLIILDEMKSYGLPAPLRYEVLFKRKKAEMETPLEPNSFPGVAPHPEDREAQWQQPHRDRKTGKMVPHPLDYDVSYKDF